MYFRAFEHQGLGQLDPKTAYRAEYLATEILASADPAFLRRALNEGILIRPLYDEIRFVGAFSAAELPRVKEFLAAEDRPTSPILKVARELANHPTDEHLRKEILAPIHPLPASLGQ